jgi:hypothetical protein
MKLTRRQVAAILQKSVATVRRLEGHVLHPRRDARGTHWFESEEIDRLQTEPSITARWASSKWLRERRRTAESSGRCRRPSLRSLLEVCTTLAVTARRGRLARSDEVLVSRDAFDELLDLLAQHADDGP